MSSSTVPVSTTGTTVTATTAADPSVEYVIEHAIDHLLGAGSYAFEVDVTLSVQGSPVDSRITGWVDGEDRELRLVIDDREVVTRVIDGTATITRGDVVTEIPVREADAAPSLELLRSIKSARFLSPTEISGKLNASDLRNTGFDTNGTATITIRVTDGGMLEGYEMNATNASWTASAQFSDIGASFTP